MAVRRRRDGRPEPLGRLLEGILADTGIGRAVREEALEAEWRAAVGSEVAGHTRLAGLSGGRLRVEVDSAGLLQELATFYRKQILESLRAGKVGRGVSDIQFKLGAF